MIHESHKRSIFKAISWRFAGSAVTMVIAWLLTGRLDLVALVGTTELVGKIALYYLHERLWDRVPFGRSGSSEAEKPKAFVIWFTGLPCSGKTTLATRLSEQLYARGFPTEHLDGDRIRDALGAQGFSREERERHLKYMGYLASVLEQQQVTVIASFVSPYQASRDFARSLCRHFVEVHVATPLEICSERDVKGHYAKALSGRLENFTGVGSDYEAPREPELVIDTSERSVDECVEQILDYLKTLSFNENWQGTDEQYSYGPSVTAGESQHLHTERSL